METCNETFIFWSSEGLLKTPNMYCSANSAALMLIKENGYVPVVYEICLAIW